MSNGLLVRVHAGAAEAPYLERELAAAVGAGSPTSGAFALRFRRGDYATFTPAAGDDPVTQEVRHRIEPLLATPVERETVDVLAAKPLRQRSEFVTKAALLRFDPRPDHESDVEDLLATDAELLDDEPDAPAWYALRMPGGELGLFDVFPTSWARVRHLRRLVRRDLRGWGRSVMGGFPGVHLLDVMAATPGIPRPPGGAPAAAATAEQAVSNAIVG
jgi:hypothetical protein